MGTRRRAALCLVSMIALACGGGGTAPPPPPPPPPPPAPPASVAVQAGDNQTATAGTAVPTPPAVKVTNVSGTGVAGVSVTFSVTGGGGTVSGANATTGSDGVASVGGWTLGTTGGVNTLTATVAGNSINGNPTVFHATGQLLALHPTSNFTLSAGTYTYTDVVIPAGVTVTLSGDVTINAAGPISIGGSITGNCVAVSISSDALLTLGGMITNSCGGALPGTGAPAIQLVGKGGYTVDHGGTVSSGPVSITNDPTLTHADFVSPFIAQRGGVAMPAAGAPSCSFVQGTFTASPLSAPNGANGKGGQPGTPGATWAATCRGDMIVTGPFTLVGQSGGSGGNGADLAATAVATAGAGAKGGDLTIGATGDMVFSAGSVTRITSGAGGAGGSASATASSPGGNANATGGLGAGPGLIDVEAAGAITIDAPFTLNVGAAGDGGSANAAGGDGHSGVPTCAAQVGGAAIATAGLGGSSPDKTLTGKNVSGIGNVTVTGGAAGRGGDGTAHPGKGGDGAQPCKPGAAGGSQFISAGRGGDALLKDQNGALVAPGGRGGAAIFQGGRGGNGWSDCVPNNFEAGGDGGRGGDAGGNSGLGGTGASGLGPAGPVALDAVGNGGDGGNGSGTGAGGVGGTNSIGANGPKTEVRPSFNAGAPGLPCTPPGGSIDVRDEFGNVLDLTTKVSGKGVFLIVTVRDGNGVVIPNAHVTITISDPLIATLGGFPGSPAIDFLKAGTVDVTVTTDSGGSVTLHFTVKDPAVPVSEAFMDALIEMFAPGGKVFTSGNDLGGPSSIPAPRSLPSDFASGLGFVPVPLGHIYTAIAAGSFHACALLTSGVPECWGNNLVGQLGTSGTASATNPTPMTLPAGVTAVSQIFAKNGQTCVLTSNGTAYCTGLNTNGQLGTGNTAAAFVLTAVSTTRKFVTLALGDDHTCGISTNGLDHFGNTIYQLLCWGGNQFGQLGDGTQTSRLVPGAPSPLPVQGIPLLTAVYAGRHHTCIVGAGGLVGVSTGYSCFGDNSGGQLGDGTIGGIVKQIPDFRTLPSSVRPGVMALGDRHTCAQSNVGPFCWGQNDFGQLAIPGVTQSLTPAFAIGPPGVSWNLYDIWASGRNTVCMGRTGHDMYCWGDNAGGQLGPLTAAVFSIVMVQAVLH